MDYFYVDQQDVNGHTLVLREDESKHLVRVLRKSVGDRIFVTDGNDTMYEAIVAGIGKTSATCDIAAIHRRYNESHAEVTLAVSILKNPARFDFLVEKATELGVRAIIPLRCERTLPHHEKHGRLEKIALAAMKQCGRSWLPRIQPLQDFTTLAGSSSHWPLKLIPHEKTDPRQTATPEIRQHEGTHSVLVAVGPEGGFTEEEIRLAGEAGFKQISLGARRLRTETAVVVVLAQLLE